VHAVQAKLAKPDGVVCNTALWTIGNRELSGIAEEIAAWISTEADEPKDMETAITVWDRRLDDSPSHKARRARARSSSGFLVHEERTPVS
jgi:hypothetical protein